MIDITLLVREETFNKLKTDKRVQIQSKSDYSLSQEIYVSNRAVTMDLIVGKIIGKDRIRSSHGKMFLYTIGCK